MVFMSVNMILYKSSVVLAGLILQDDRQTGLLATALQLSEFVWVIPIAIEGVMIQSTAILWKRGGTLEIEHLTARLVRYTSVLVLGILVPMLVLADHVLALYFGEEFVPAAHALRILIPGVFSYSLSRVIYPVLQSKGTVIVMVVVTTVAAGFNIAGYLLVVPRWGIAGGAVVTSVAYGMVIVFYARLLRRAGVAVFSGFRPGGQVVASLAAAAAAALTTMMFTGHLVVVLAGFAASALLYVAAVFRLGVLSVREMESLVVSLPDAVRGKMERIVRWCSPWLLMLEGDKRAP
jgi:O-antigen/teichoic acid export membrane protein